MNTEDHFFSTEVMVGEKALYKTEPNTYFYSQWMRRDMTCGDTKKSNNDDNENKRKPKYGKTFENH